MVAFLKTWTINIVIVLIFITFLEILLPNSTMKKYIRMIVGLLVMIVILNPILALFNEEIRIEEEIFKVSSEIDQKTMIINTNQFQEKQREHFIKIYKEKIERHVKERIEHYKKVEVLKVVAKIEEDRLNENFGTIKHLHIVLSNRKNLQDEEQIQFVSNIKINIDNQKQEFKSSKDDEKSQIIQFLKEDLSVFYHVKKENIQIDMHEIDYKMREE